MVGLALLACAPAMAEIYGPVQPPAGDGTAVPNYIFLELFTAETCPFCPQAERNFNDITQDPAVIGYTCMVDYFDPVGTNPLSRPFCTEQQDLYIRMMKSGSRYTPQIVVNGTEQVGGHQLNVLLKTVQDARAEQAQPLAIDVRPGTEPGSVDSVLPALTGHADDEKFVLRLVGVQQKVEPNPSSPIRARRDLTTTNLATALYEGGLWNGKKTIWRARPTLPAGTDRIIALVQERDTGRILAAGQMDFVAPE